MFSLRYFPLTKELLCNSQVAGRNAMEVDPADGTSFNNSDELNLELIR